jgi:hypothetical protein
MFFLSTPSSLEIPLPLLIDCEDAKVLDVSSVYNKQFRNSSATTNGL